MIVSHLSVRLRAFIVGYNGWALENFNNFLMLIAFYDAPFDGGFSLVCNNSVA